jgi:hypothetical protein
LENQFESFIIPARYFPDLSTDYICQQRGLFVEPFLNAFNKNKETKGLFLTLPLTVPMLLDRSYRISILDWITSYPEITGIYLLVFFDESSKQLQNYDKMIQYYSFIQSLQEADLQIICGYCNTEGILLTLFDVYGLTMGAYENTRGFSIDKFLEDDRTRRGPAARIFLPNLLNWIRWPSAVEIRSDFPDLWGKIYSPTDYAETVFSRGTEPHFTQPDLYKHHFKLMASIYENLSTQSISSRIKTLRTMISTAHSLYSELKKAGILFFDENCQGGHLPIWNRLLRNISLML